MRNRGYVLKDQLHNLYYFADVVRLGHLIWTGHLTRIEKSEMNTAVLLYSPNINKIILYEDEMDNKCGTHEEIINS
jgi:hypothetical protein